jgi:hypothetical protein
MKADPGNATVASGAADGLYRLGSLVDGGWAEHVHPRIYVRHALEGGGERVVATAPGGDPQILRSLAANLTPPFRLLYVLHQPRGEAAVGRYESPDLSAAELDGFFERFGAFLQRDSRFDLWIFSIENGAAVIWDRHDLVWAYSRADAFEETMRALGFGPGQPAVPSPHVHHEHHALRGDADALIRFFAWKHTPLLRMDVE